MKSGENIQLTFLGAAGTVTGSRYLVTAGARRILVDCGLFQGLKRLRERNWQRLTFEPASLDAVLLTHGRRHRLVGPHDNRDGRAMGACWN